MQLRDWKASRPEPVDPSLRRFCPRCNTVTVWDTELADGVYCCTNFRDGETEYCGLMLRDELTDEEERNRDRYDALVNPQRPRSGYLLV